MKEDQSIEKTEIFDSSVQILDSKANSLIAFENKLDSFEVSIEKGCVIKKKISLYCPSEIIKVKKDFYLCTGSLNEEFSDETFIFSSYLIRNRNENLKLTS